MISDKTISIVTACYNEEENVEALFLQVRDVMAAVGRYRYEHIFIDNASTDATVSILNNSHAPAKDLLWFKKHNSL